MLSKNFRSLLIGATILLGVFASFCLIASFSQASLLFGLFEVSAPTTYDGNSYFNEIVNYADSVQAGAFSQLIKSYGALVVALYSPCIIFGLKYWPLLVNVFLMGVALSNYFVIFENSSKFYLFYLPRSHTSGLLILITLLSSLDPYYIGSYLVPSKDILSLFLVSFLGLWIVNNNHSGQGYLPLFRARAKSIVKIFILILIILAMFFTRISVFLGSCFYFIADKLVRSNSKRKYIPVFCFLFSYISASLISLLVSSSRIEFQSEGGLFNSLLLTPFKLLLTPAMPAIYAFWDLFKPVLSGSSLNIVLASFALIAIPLTYIFYLLYLAYFSSLCLKTYSLPSSNNIFGFSSSILGSAMANTYVHPRYIYEVMPLLAISLFFYFPNHFKISRLFMAVLLITLLKFGLVYQPFISVASEMPVYVLPPFLN